MFHRLSFVVLAFFMFFATLVRAQTSPPACAQSCINNANPGSCSLTDNACMCTDASFCNAMNLCFEDSCDQSDWVNAYNWANNVCAAAGVTQQIVLNPPTKRAVAPEPRNTAFVPVYMRNRSRSRK